MELLNAGPDINNAKPNVHMRDNTLDCVLNIFDSDAMNNDIAVTSLTEKHFISRLAKFSACRYRTRPNKCRRSTPYEDNYLMYA